MERGFRVREIHTCPVWQEPDGTRTIGFDGRDDPPPVVAWCNVIVCDISGQSVRLLANGQEATND